MNRLTVLGVGLMVGLLLLLGACAPAGTAAPAPGASPTHAAATAIPQSAGSPAPPTPTPQPAHPTAQPTALAPLPTLSPNAQLPWGAPLPTFHGATEDAEALWAGREAIAPLLSHGEVWLAQWPPSLPADLPLPSQGWLDMAVHFPNLDGENWALLMEADVPAQEWLSAYEEALTAAGWERDTVPWSGGIQAGTVMEPWCFPEAHTMLSVRVAPLGDKHTVIALNFMHPEDPSHPVCFKQQAEVGGGSPPRSASMLPTLQLPQDVRAPGFGSEGGDSSSWAQERTLETSRTLPSLMDAFLPQLKDQGWQPDTPHFAAVNGRERAYLRANRTDDEGHTWMLHLYLEGETPHYRLWLQVMRPPEGPFSIRETPSTEAWHGQHEASLLLRALALAHWTTGGDMTPSEIWIAQAPTPWPFQTLPQPQGATWVVAVHGPHYGASNRWEMVFRLPQAPSQAEETLAQTLTAAGWQDTGSDDTPLSRGFLDAQSAEDNPHATHLFCSRDGAWGLQEALFPTDDGGTRVSWSILPPEVCAPGGPLAGDPWAEAPALELTLPQGARMLSGAGGGGATSADWQETALWISPVSMDEQARAFAEQMQAQGWDDVASGALDDALVWVSGQQTYHGTSYYAEALLFSLSEDASGPIEGVLWLHRGPLFQPPSGP